MAQSFINPGDRFEATLVSGETTLRAGNGYLVGGMFGVITSLTRNGQTVFTNQASAPGDIAVLALEGVFSLPKATGAVTVGAKVYWDNVAKNVTTTVGSNTFIGYAWQAQASGDTTVQVRLRTA